MDTEQLKPGAIVTAHGETREVLAIKNGRVYYSWPGKVMVRSMLFASWRAWQATATSGHSSAAQHGA